MKKLLVAFMILGAVILVIPNVANAVPLAGWSGSTVMSTPFWTATVYYDVYAPMQADAPGIGSVAYYAYFYRIENAASSTATLKHFTVNNVTRAPITAVNTTDYLGGINPPAFGNAEDSIVYDFWAVGQNNSIPAGGHSDWCYYTSPAGPTWGRGSSKDGGEALFGRMPNPAPEPAAMLLFGIGSALMAFKRRKR